MIHAPTLHTYYGMKCSHLMPDVLIGGRVAPSTLILHHLTAAIRNIILVPDRTVRPEEEVFCHSICRAVSTPYPRESENEGRAVPDSIRLDIGCGLRGGLHQHSRGCVRTQN